MPPSYHSTRKIRAAHAAQLGEKALPIMPKAATNIVAFAAEYRKSPV
jgi:hypothetical protein